MPKLSFYIKFENAPPEKWSEESFESFWYNLREFMFRNGSARLEWIIRD